MTTDVALQGGISTQKHFNFHILRHNHHKKRRNKKPHGGTMRKHPRNEIFCCSSLLRKRSSKVPGNFTRQISRHCSADALQLQMPNSMAFFILQTLLLDKSKRQGRFCPVRPWDRLIFYVRPAGGLQNDLC